MTAFTMTPHAILTVPAPGSVATRPAPGGSATRGTVGAGQAAGSTGPGAAPRIEGAARSAALAARARAVEVLERLEAEHRRLEARLQELGRRDAIRSVTGRSSLEHALADTRAMIESLDRLVSGSRPE